MAEEGAAMTDAAPVAAPAPAGPAPVEEIGARRAAPRPRAPAASARPVLAPPSPRLPPLPPPSADQNEALRRVIVKSLVVDGVRRGLHEAVKALARATKQDGAVPVGGARLAILAADCDEASYVAVVKALAAEKGVPLIEVPLAAQLGEWCVSLEGRAEASARCQRKRRGNARRNARALTPSPARTSPLSFPPALQVRPVQGRPRGQAAQGRLDVVRRHRRLRRGVARAPDDPRRRQGVKRGEHA